MAFLQGRGQGWLDGGVGGLSCSGTKYYDVGGGEYVLAVRKVSWGLLLLLPLYLLLPVSFLQMIGLSAAEQLWGWECKLRGDAPLLSSRCMSRGLGRQSVSCPGFIENSSKSVTKSVPVIIIFSLYNRRLFVVCVSDVLCRNDILLQFGRETFLYANAAAYLFVSLSTGSWRYGQYDGHGTPEITVLPSE